MLLFVGFFDGSEEATAQDNDFGMPENNYDSRLSNDEEIASALQSGMRAIQSGLRYTNMLDVRIVH